MRTRAIWSVVALTPLIVVGCASKPTQRDGFSSETSGAVVVQPSPPVVIQPGQQVVVQPPQSPTVVTSGSPVVQADDIRANEVRALTIYANKIRAPEIQGAIHPTGEVKIDRSVPDLRVPTVVASVLYADTIEAHRVVADHIFVRDLDRR